MRLSEGVEWAVHSVVVLAFFPPGGALTAAQLAEYHDLPTAYLAKQLQALARAGVLETVRGRGGGYRLARPAEEITVLDCVEAIEGREPAFRCTEIRRRGPAAVPAAEYRTMCGVHVAMVRADEAWRAELRATTVADLVLGVVRDASPKALEQGASWAAEILGGSR
ncbi:MAG TPA: Rrf2 family transcriptional regulator [Acidimicrobiia bacterium]|nr:Rrf2 family transcriptional regulator [Acidimicrobiia bacterium]